MFGLRRLVVLACLVACVAAPAAQADVRSDADAIMNMNYNAFVAYKAQHHPTPFDWSDDGCSGLPVIKKIYANLFNKPCQMHDFGYRNYGTRSGGLALSPNEDTRAWIDGRLSEEMVRLCRETFDKPLQAVNKAACLAESGYIWGVVRNVGPKAFYR
ncbi:MAG: phospholipase A2 [Solirubrobacteraceae bacterium]